MLVLVATARRLAGADVVGLKEKIALQNCYTGADPGGCPGGPDPPPPLFDVYL